MNQQRDSYFEAVAYFQSVIDQIQPDHWEQPGLGAWSVRDLVGHTSRSLTTVVRDITQPAPDSRDLAVAADYYVNVLAVINQMSGVAERGRQAGRELGADPVAAVRELERPTRDILAATPDDTRVATPFGRLPLPEYLNIKIFELIVHTLDICAAIGVETEPPVGPLDDALRVVLDLAARRPDPTERRRLLMALTGRTALPASFGGI